jgi:oligoribonuclease NrnB/cAMP/cGMP phosphodiesterase (DHH superfamily)
MRIVTRPDFDGVVCAALLYETESINKPTQWVEPNDMQKGLVEIFEGDIIANLPYNENCSLWFDHHYSNQPRWEFKGAFKIAPSAAGVVFNYYQGRFTHDYTELIEQADKIDSADLTKDEVIHPENYPYVLLSMTISGRETWDEAYWNHLVALLRKKDIGDVMEDSQVSQRCREVVEQNNRYKVLLEKHTRMQAHVAITDFRDLDKTPPGNRFLSYCMFPDSIVNVKIRYDNADRTKLIVSVGHSIFNQKCRVNVGELLSRFEGGGHEKAGSCAFHAAKADAYIPKIIEALIRNQAED